MTTEPRIFYEFGPFRMDPDKQVLYREDQPVPLTPKAFQTLLALVRRSRQMVSKEELLKEIWPNSFVEESNLSQHIFLLRRALGDTSENREYIVTLPGRGYRFAAPVRNVTAQGEALMAQSLTRTQILIEENEGETSSQPIALPVPQKSRRGRAILLSLAVVVVMLAAGVLLLIRSRRSANQGRKQPILVADFLNATGDPVFDDTLRQGMEVQLEQSPSLRLVSEDRIRQALEWMGKPTDTRLTGRMAREVCERSAGDAVLEGSIQPLGGHYVLNLHSVDCQSGENIYDQQVQVTRKEDALDAVTRMARGFRVHAGESIEAVERHDTPLAGATTSSLEALKAYSLGWKIAAAQGAEPAVPFFQRAVEIDPRFAMAYASLALMFGSSGSSQLAAENITRAYGLRDRASDKERFFITAYYLGRAVGNQEKAQQVCDQWARTYPLEFLPHSFLAGFIDLVLADYQKAVEEARKTVEMSPDDSLGYYLLGYNSLYVNDLQGAERAVQAASEHKADQVRIATLRFDLAYLREDAAGVQHELERARAQPETLDWLLDRQASAEVSEGRLKDAMNLSNRAVALALQGGRREQAALFETRAALWQAFFGDSVEAKRRATVALSLARNREVSYGAALVLALGGTLAQAGKLANHLQEDYPEDTSVRFSYLPVIRAVAATRHGKPVEAIDKLLAGVPYEMGSPRSSQTAFFGSLYPVFFHGQALLAEHKGAEAANEFQQVLSHRGVMVGDPVWVLAHIGLARACALSGDYAKARSEYSEFLALWRNADPDNQLLKRTQAEAGKIR